VYARIAQRSTNPRIERKRIDLCNDKTCRYLPEGDVLYSAIIKDGHAFGAALNEHSACLSSDDFTPYEKLNMDAGTSLMGKIVHLASGRSRRRMIALEQLVMQASATGMVSSDLVEVMQSSILASEFYFQIRS